MHVINKNKAFGIQLEKMSEYKNRKGMYFLNDIWNKEIKLYKIFEALWGLLQDILSKFIIILINDFILNNYFLKKYVFI